MNFGAKIRTISIIARGMPVFFSAKSFRAFSFKHDVADDFPKIVPVGFQRMLEIGFKIAPLAFLYFLQGFGHIDIVGRKQSWLGFGPQFLYLF